MIFYIPQIGFSFDGKLYNYSGESIPDEPEQRTHSIEVLTPIKTSVSLQNGVQLIYYRNHSEFSGSDINMQVTSNMVNFSIRKQPHNSTTNYSNFEKVVTPETSELFIKVDSQLCFDYLTSIGLSFMIEGDMRFNKYKMEEIEKQIS